MCYNCLMNSASNYLYSMSLYCTALHCTLHSTILYYTILHYTAQHYTSLHCIVVHCTEMRCKLHSSALKEDFKWGNLLFQCLLPSSSYLFYKCLLHTVHSPTTMSNPLNLCIKIMEILGITNYSLSLFRPKMIFFALFHVFSTQTM